MTHETKKEMRETRNNTIGVKWKEIDYDEGTLWSSKDKLSLQWISEIISTLENYKILYRYEGDQKENTRSHQLAVECTQGVSWAFMKSRPSA